MKFTKGNNLSKGFKFHRVIISGNVNDKLKFKIWLFKSNFGIRFANTHLISIKNNLTKKLKPIL